MKRTILSRCILLREMAETDPKLSQRKDDDGRYPIHWAASSNNLDIVVLLANQASFDPDIQVSRPSSHTSPSVTCNKGNLWLTFMANQDASGWTALMISASVPDSEPVLRVLLQKGADINEKTRLLLDTKPPASTRVRDRRGQYPIHRAAAVGSAPMINLLLKNRSPLNPTDNEGYTPLHHAVAEGHADAAVVLLKEGADFTIKNSDDVLALDLAPDSEVRRYIMQGAEREGIDLSSS
ncbi:Ankyrin repeat-containing protein C6C3.08 [Tolypocladium ophioglossoides CBS 100239]|uniref:Ankyrin repeat-containing protein C6C3.08 n=1 Tax=Tolypocladium ophioglossoides (strain CBS 100239) TaxID=1163406 RepID=A0A0L0N8I3_TOLOC|nr:Ankyrin repeat-containing protein C6C3.08 [Tolypocladium ophioglossoides CBS 100239]